MNLKSLTYLIYIYGMNEQTEQEDKDAGGSQKSVIFNYFIFEALWKILFDKMFYQLESLKIQNCSNALP